MHYLYIGYNALVTFINLSSYRSTALRLKFSDKTYRVCVCVCVCVKLVREFHFHGHGKMVKVPAVYDTIVRDALRSLTITTCSYTSLIYSLIHLNETLYIFWIHNSNIPKVILVNNVCYGLCYGAVGVAE